MMGDYFVFEKWLGYALLSLLLYGFWGFFPKLAVTYLRPLSALVYEVGGAIIVGVICLAVIGFRPEIQTKGILFAVLTGICGMLGTLLFFAAAVKGKISVVVSITALYPLITILLAALILKEPLTCKQVAGMLFALLAIILFVT
ncbi:hypothetical protein MNBD_DELTA04-169 [hydrothermal vent metagenome]|uniref:EamA domain-containing protein n=1 Tax=hydrothermal vent metagenome TaxID=652676 RepID=A0A3B0W335_9ZZZZ